jgi:hypothetical protein
LAFLLAFLLAFSLAFSSAFSLALFLIVVKKKKEQMQGQNNQLDILQGVNWSTHDWAASK